MKWIHRLLFLGITLAVCLGWLIAAILLAQDDNKKPQVTDKNSTVIGYMQSRDRIVTISTGPKGTVYTIKNKDGKALAENISEKDLQEKYPSVYSQVKYGLVGNDATLRILRSPKD